MVHKILLSNGGVILELRGEVSLDKVITVKNILTGQSYFDNLLFQLWDFIGIESVLLDIERDLAVVTAFDKAAIVWNNKMLIAIITDKSDLAQFWNGYKIRISKTGWQCEVFNTRTSALDWINSIVNVKVPS